MASCCLGLNSASAASRALLTGSLALAGLGFCQSLDKAFSRQHRFIGNLKVDASVRIEGLAGAGVSLRDRALLSGHPAVHHALRNHYFNSLGLPQSLVAGQA